MKYLIYPILILFIVSCSSNKWVQTPIVFDEERAQLSLQYLKDRYGIIKEEAVIDPKMIVIHWTAIPTFEGSYKAFYPSKLPGARGDIQSASALNVSVPFLIDRDGTTYQLMHETQFGRHVIGLNHCAIGVENVGDGDQNPLTEKQLEANVNLVRKLVKMYPEITYLIGHHEYQSFQNHELWLEKDANYRTVKSDPGDAFMQSLRASLKDLNLKGPE